MSEFNRSPNFCSSCPQLYGRLQPDNRDVERLARQRQEDEGLMPYANRCSGPYVGMEFDDDSTPTRKLVKVHCSAVVFANIDMQLSVTPQTEVRYASPEQDALPEDLGYTPEI